MSLASPPVGRTDRTAAEIRDVVLVGHPFAPMGMGEQVRVALRAFRAAAVPVRVRDLYGHISEHDASLHNELDAHLCSDLGEHVNIFHINGDEIDQAVAHLGGTLPKTAFNISVPAWELPNYPKTWATKLELFDEIWANSRFIYAALSAAVSKPVAHMSLASEAHMARFMGRRYFGIPESTFTFLFSFDFSSYMERKNPFAVLRAFEKLASALPYAPITLVIKLNHGKAAPADYDHFHREVKQLRDRVIVIDRGLDDDEIKNLVRCSDCYVSLHRSEGFGFGMAEAMFLGKPVIATGYSGNLDFMTPENSLLVGFRTIPVAEGSYPHATGQTWADPDIDEAAGYMREVFEDRQLARRLGEAASRHIRTYFSYRARGLAYRDRLSSSAAHNSARVTE